MVDELATRDRFRECRVPQASDLLSDISFSLGFYSTLAISFWFDRERYIFNDVACFNLSNVLHICVCTSEIQAVVERG